MLAGAACTVGMRGVGEAVGVGVVLAAAIGVLGSFVFDQGAPWVVLLVGAVAALVLWLILWCGAAGQGGVAEARVSLQSYALAAVVALVLGCLLSAVGHSPVMWSVGVIVAGVLIPAAARARRPDAD